MLSFISNHSHYVAVAIGLIIGTVFLIRNRDLSVIKSEPMIVLLCFFFSAVSVLSALLFSSAEVYLTERSFSFGSISTYGIYLLCPLFLFLSGRIFKLDYRRLFDTYTYYAIISLIILRMNCIHSGCCYGKPIFHTSFLWPTRESEILFYIIMFILIIKKFNNQNNKTGSLFPMLMFSYGSFRFINEFFRHGEGIFRLAHIWSILSVIIGYSIYSELNKKKSINQIK